MLQAYKFTFRTNVWSLASISYITNLQIRTPSALNQLTVCEEIDDILLLAKDSTQSKIVLLFNHSGSISWQCHLQRCAVSCFHYRCFHCEHFYMKQTARMQTPHASSRTSFYNSNTYILEFFYLKCANMLHSWFVTNISHKWMHCSPEVLRHFQNLCQRRKEDFFINGMMKHCTRHNERSPSSRLLYSWLHFSHQRIYPPGQQHSQVTSRTHKHTPVTICTTRYHVSARM